MLFLLQSWRVSGGLPVNVTLLFANVLFKDVESGGRAAGLHVCRERENMHIVWLSGRKAWRYS